MTLEEIAEIRTGNQGIGQTEFKTAVDVVRWMGAMQAQDFLMAKWGIGIRMAEATEEKMDGWFNAGELIRMHLMRPTWHLVPAEDVYWMLELTAPRIRSAMRSRHRQLGLSESLVKKSNRIIEKALRKHQYLTGDELALEFGKARITTDENRLWHMMLCAELDGIVCSGPLKGRKHTFALLRERVPHQTRLTREESLAELAKRYFSSHGPATIRDFSWWSGLTLTDARRAANLVKPDFITEQVGADLYIFQPSKTERRHTGTRVHLLPAFDEFLIGYTDRTATLSLTHHKKAVSSNGIFRPVIVVNGQITGTWKRRITRDKVMIECMTFKKPDKLTRDLILEEASGYGRFLGMGVGVAFK